MFILTRIHCFSKYFIVYRLQKSLVFKEIKDFTEQKQFAFALLSEKLKDTWQD